jgi:hypothetical protein
MNLSHLKWGRCLLLGWHSKKANLYHHYYHHYISQHALLQVDQLKKYIYLCFCMYIDWLINLHRLILCYAKINNVHFSKLIQSALLDCFHQLLKWLFQFKWLRESPHNVPTPDSHYECRWRVNNIQTVGYPNSGWIPIGLTNHNASQLFQKSRLEDFWNGWKFVTIWEFGESYLIFLSLHAGLMCK